MRVERVQASQVGAGDYLDIEGKPRVVDTVTRYAGGRVRISTREPYESMNPKDVALEVGGDEYVTLVARWPHHPGGGHYYPGQGRR